MDDEAIVLTRRKLDVDDNHGIADAGIPKKGHPIPRRQC